MGNFLANEKCYDDGDSEVDCPQNEVEESSEEETTDEESSEDSTDEEDDTQTEFDKQREGLMDRFIEIY